MIFGYGKSESDGTIGIYVGVTPNDLCALTDGKDCQTQMNVLGQMVVVRVGFGSEEEHTRFLESKAHPDGLTEHDENGKVLSIEEQISQRDGR